MYKKYLIDKSINNVCVVGDLHGKFNLLKFKIKESGITNTLIIIAGDCGFGFEKQEYYKQQYNRLKKILFEQNVFVVFVRGNHDDKTFFDGEKINFKNFIATPDYSVINVTTESGDKNILCVGGAISADRTDRINYQQIKGNKSYWEDEFPIYEPTILNEIKSDGINIDVVVTHTSPNFAPLLNKNGTSSWLLVDSKLSKDLDNERQTITEIYNHIIQDKHPVKVWLYGHFHEHSVMYSNEEVKFVMLDMFGGKYNSWDIYQIYF